MWIRRCTRLLFAAGMLCLGTASAAETSKLQDTLEEVASRARPEVGLYYSRALAPVRYSDFRHSFGMQLALGAQIDPTLVVRASMSLDRELGAPIEKFRASNTTLSATKLFNLEKIGWLRPTAFIRLPTHGEDRYYLSYRGSAGASVGLFNERLYALNDKHVFGGGISLTGARNVFLFTTSREGGMHNRLWSLGATASAVYTLYDNVSFSLSFKDTMNWTYVGRDADRYEIAGAVSYSAPYDLRLSLMTVTSDRTFQHDQTTLNVNLYKPENTMLVFSVSYVPRYERF